MANGNMQPIDRITQLENLVLALIEALFGHKRTDEPAHEQLAKLEIPAHIPAQSPAETEFGHKRTDEPAHEQLAKLEIPAQPTGEVEKDSANPAV